MSGNAAAPSKRTVHVTCPLCEATCGLSVEIEGDRVLRVRGDPLDVLSRGFVCPKGTALGELHHDPDRLREPLLRAGGRLRSASWDEAFEAVERGLAPMLEGGDRNSIGVYLGNPNVHGLGGTIFLKPLLQALATRNIFSASTVDQMPKHVSCGLLFGDPDAIPVPDIDRTHYLLMLGANPLESNGSLWTAPDLPRRLRALRKRGGKLVVIDPRRTRTAREADEHWFIRPGSDSLLLLALAHTLFDEDRVALGRLSPHLDRCDALSSAVRPFAPERVASVCGLQAESIRRLARELAAAESAAVYGRIGTHTVSFGTLAAWAVDVLNILTGNLDRAGGAMFPSPDHRSRPTTPGGSGFQTGRWHSRVRGLPEVRGEFPVGTLIDEIETPGEGQIRALLTIAGNPVLSTQQGDRLDAALGGLDFMLSVDPYLNETTRHADVILPPPSALERPHYDLAFSGFSVRNVANYSPATFEAPGPSEPELLARLAGIAAGRGAANDPAELGRLLLLGGLFAATRDDSSSLHGRDPAELLAQLPERPMEERILDALLRAGAYGDGFGNAPDGLSLDRLSEAPHGLDLGALVSVLPNRLETESGRIDLLPEPIMAELSRLEMELASPGRLSPKALSLVGRRHLRSNNSWMHNLPSLVSGRDRCTLQIHSLDAARRGLADGQLVRVRSKVGALEVRAELCDDLMPGVVSLPHGWGHDRPGMRMRTAERRPGINVNQLTDGSDLDPLSGNAVLNGVSVEVEAVAN